MQKSKLKNNQVPLKKSKLKKESSSHNKNKLKERQEQQDADYKFYQEVWRIRKGRSDLTSRHLGEEIMIIFFHHLLPKAKYPEYRHCDWNILLCEAKYHAQIEINEEKLPEDIYTRFKEFENNAKEKASQIND